MAKKGGVVRAGIGGWTFEPWRGTFYPEGLPQAQELDYASRHLTSIEVNGTFYRTQTPTTFAKWASETPDGFVFALKGPRYATNRRVLAEAGDSIKRFLDSGPTALGDKLGPLLWQFAPTKKFDEADFAAFLELLPREPRRRALRHTVEVRHDSFVTPAFIELLREHDVARRVRRARDLPGHRRRHRRLRLRAAAAGQGRVKTGYHRRRSTPGPSAPAPGPRAACRPICRLPIPSTRRQGPPARRVRLLHPRGQSARPHAAIALLERLQKS